MGKIFIYFIALLLFACSTTTDPQKIVDKALEAAGGDRFLNATIEFDFRDRHYISRRNGGLFKHERILIDSTGTTRDILNNEGLTREFNGVKIEVPDTMRAKYASSTNSVIYFALLPYGLNDLAVNKKYLGEKEINGKQYYKIEITFQQEGGGEDHSDVFHYWINKESFVIDYLSYLYHTDGGGVRLREAYNRRVVNGITFQDYINYKPKDETISLEELESLYLAGELVELSRIELVNVSVE